MQSRNNNNTHNSINNTQLQKLWKEISSQQHQQQYPTFFLMMQSEPFFNDSVGGNFGQASAITQNSSPGKNEPKKYTIYRYIFEDCE